MRRKKMTDTGQGRKTLADAIADYKGIAADCAFDGGIFCEDDERTRLLKWVCWNKLTEGERVILFLYSDWESIRELCNALGVARSTLADELQRIRRKVKTEMEKGYDA